ncbi:YrhA family protein [Siccibacter colletis]|uniref:YrhA family protein n=1 Tax=Siccibacter colletis TaxID=1505757 RepID=UPI003CF79C26
MDESVKHNHLNQVITSLRTEMSEFGYQFEPPVNLHELDIYINTLADVPIHCLNYVRTNQEYRHFLSVMNGVEYNSFILYGMSDSIYTPCSEFNIFDINKFNQNPPFEVDPHLIDKVEIARLPPGIYLYNPSTHKYEDRDAIGTEYIYQQFDTLADMLQAAIARVCKN